MSATLLLAMRRWSFLLIGVLWLTGCSSSSPAAPTSSSLATPVFTLTGVVRDALPNGGGAGFTVPAVTIDVIGKPGVIATTTTGSDGTFHVPKMAGRFDVRAQRPGYQPATVSVGPLTSDRTVDIPLVPIPVRLSGLVRESDQFGGGPVAAARVAVASGSNTGRVAITDAGGRYVLDGVWGEFTLSVTREGFQEETRRIVLAGVDQVADSRLTRLAAVLTQTITHDPFELAFVAHGNGQVAIIDFFGTGFEEGDSSLLQIFEEGRLAAEMRAERSAPRNTILLRVPATVGHTYLVRATPSGGRPLTMTVSYPG